MAHFADHPQLSRPLPPRNRWLQVELGRTAWLDRPPIWQHGRLHWVDLHGPFVPSPTDLANAHFSLTRLAARADEWERLRNGVTELVAFRLQRLALAHELALLPTIMHQPELAALAPSQLWLLAHADLLTAEPLPLAYQAALLRTGETAAALLQQMLPSAPPELQVLGLALLGALGAPLRPLAKLAHPLAQRAYALGQAEFARSDPHLLLALAHDEAGLARAEALQLAQRNLPNWLAAPPALWRTLLRQGLGLAEIHALIAALNDAAPTLRALLQRRPLRRGRALPPDRSFLAHAQPTLARLLFATAQHHHASLPLAIKLLITLSGDDQVIPPRFALFRQLIEASLALPANLHPTWLEILLTAEPLWCTALEPPIDQAWLSAYAQRTLIPLQELLERTARPDLIAFASQERLANQITSERLSGDQAIWLLETLRWLAIPPRPNFYLFRIMSQRLPSADLRRWLNPLLNLLKQRGGERTSLLVGELLSSIPGRGAALRQRLRRLQRNLPLLLIVNEPSHMAHILVQLDELLAASADEAQARRWIARAEQAFSTYITFYEPTQIALRSAIRFARQDDRRFEQVLELLLSSDLTADSFKLLSGLTLLSEQPALDAACNQLILEQPRRCQRMIARLPQLKWRSPSVYRQLQSLLSDQVADLSTPLLRPAVGAWADLLALVPRLDQLAAAYIHARWMAGEETAPPPKLRQLLALPHKLATEYAHLSGLAAQRPHLAVRAANLAARLADQAGLAQTIAHEAEEWLVRAVAEARLQALENLTDEAYRLQLHQLIGPVASTVALNDDLINAIELGQTITSNRKLLRQLIRATLEGERAWREQLPRNHAFLGELRERGHDPAIWLGEWPSSVLCEGIASDRLLIHLETEPLRILQMGNLMNTCLSVGGINAFSAVANACDLNKRVIYARDSSGRVVARKLIALNQAFAVIGFETYSVLGGEVRERVTELVDRYALAFIARCGLQPAAEGEVPTLVAEAWYDDGVIEWDEIAAS